MANTESSREKFNWLLIESVLIVVSILLAFSIDAWWDARQEKREEREVMAAVLSELHDWRDRVNNVQPIMVAIRDSAEQLIRESLKNESSLNNQELDSLLADLVWPLSPDTFSAPILKSAVDSGEIRYFKNIGLRNELVMWSSLIDKIQYVAERENSRRQTHFDSFMMKHTSGIQIRNAVRHVPGKPHKTENVGQVNPYPTQSVTDHTQLLANREFQNLLLMMKGAIGDVLWYTREANISKLSATISDLETELAELGENN